jgi:hypothetical protein
MTKALWAAISSLTHGMVLVGCESKFFKRFISAWKTMNSYLNAGRTAESGAGSRASDDLFLKQASWPNQKNFVSHPIGSSC